MPVEEEDVERLDAVVADVVAGTATVGTATAASRLLAATACPNRLFLLPIAPNSVANPVSCVPWSGMKETVALVVLDDETAVTPMT